MKAITFFLIEISFLLRYKYFMENRLTLYMYYALPGNVDVLSFRN